MPDKKPFHVSGLEPTKMKVLGVNIFPLIVKVTGLMSDETRKNQVTKKVAFNYLSPTFHPDARQATRSCTIPPERERESQREPERASEGQRETEREPERAPESVVHFSWNHVKLRHFLLQNVKYGIFDVKFWDGSIFW